MTITNALEPTIKDYTHAAAGRADAAIDASRQVANAALDTVQQGVDQLRSTAPTTLSRAAAQVDEIARRSLDRARQTSAQVRDQVRDQVGRAHDATTGYIRDEPMKSVLIAAAAGAALAGLVGWLARSRKPL